MLGSAAASQGGKSGVLQALFKPFFDDQVPARMFSARRLAARLS